MEEADKRYQRVEAQLKEVIDVFYYLYIDYFWLY